MNGSQPERKQPQQSAWSELARIMGGGFGFDPMPPSQYESYMDARYPPAIRLAAWVRKHTMGTSGGKESCGGRAEYAIDTKGRPLTLKHAAAHLDMDPGNVHRAWKNLETEGWVRRDEKGRLVIVGTFKLPRLEPEIVCTDNDSDYIQKQLAKLAPHLREELLRLEDADKEFDLQVQRGLIAAKRFIFGQRQNTRWMAFGVKLRRNNYDTEEKQAERAALRDAALPLVEKFVQTIEPEVSYRPSADSAQTTYIRYSESSPEIEGKRVQTAAAAAQQSNKQQQQPETKAWSPKDWPETDRAITERFPATDGPTRLKIVEAARLAGNGTRIQDHHIALAIAQATKPKQFSGALYEQTVPAVIEAWARDAERGKR